MKKHKLSATRLQEMVLQGEDFVLELDGKQFFPVYSAALVPSVNNHVVYQGPHIKQARVGVVISVRRPHCRIERVPELHEPKDLCIDAVHESDVLAFLVRKTVKNV